MQNIRRIRRIYTDLYKYDRCFHLQMFITINRIGSLMTARSLNQFSNTSRVTKRKQDN